MKVTQDYELFMSRNFQGFDTLLHNFRNWGNLNHAKWPHTSITWQIITAKYRVSVYQIINEMVQSDHPPASHLNVIQLNQSMMAWNDIIH